MLLKWFCFLYIYFFLFAGFTFIVLVLFNFPFVLFWFFVSLTFEFLFLFLFFLSDFFLSFTINSLCSFLLAWIIRNIVIKSRSKKSKPSNAGTTMPRISMLSSKLMIGLSPFAMNQSLLHPSQKQQATFPNNPNWGLDF